MTGPRVEARSVRKAFGRTAALRGATLEVDDGEIVSITGPSGSGKSTLVLCLAGVIQPDAGEVCHAGRSLRALPDAERTLLRRREVGLVLQFGQLVPELTALQNVALPLLLDRAGRRAAERAAASWLERLGVAEVADALPGEISGGEAQRVAMARALVTGPSLVLADEPTGALDTVAGEHLLSALLDATRETGAAVVLVTHDNRVAAHADREIVLRDGRVDPAPVTR